MELNEKRATWAGVAIAALVVFSACATALTRPLWFDEIATAILSGQGSLSGITALLKTGADAQPPLFFVMTHGFARLFGGVELGLRAPAIAGFLVFLVTLFLFARRAWGPVAGVLAVALMAASEGLYYAAEARPYGPELGALSVAALLWQARKRGNTGLPTIYGIVIALAAACSLHYFGVFAAMMFGVADLVWGIRRKKIDWPLILSLPLALIPVVWSLSLIAATRSEYGTFWSHPSLKAIGACYEFFLSLRLGPPALFHLSSGRPVTLNILVPAAFLVGAIVWHLTTRRRRTPASAEPELYLGFCLLSLPVVVALIVLLVHGPFTPRYMIGGLLGTAIVMTWLIQSLGKRACWSVVALLAGVFLLQQTPNDISHLRTYLAGGRPATVVRRELAPLFQRMDAGSPTVVGDGFTFVQASFYAPPELRPRLIYLADRRTATAVIGNSANDVCLEGEAPVGGFRVVPALPFLQANREFVLATGGTPGEWLPEYLRGGGARMEPLQSFHGGREKPLDFYAVTLPVSARP